MTDFYDERESRSPEQRHNELTREVRGQLAHAKANAQAYGELFKEIDVSGIESLEDLESLPVTRKSELLELQRQNPPFGGFTAIRDGQLDHIFVSPGPIFEPQTHRPDYWRFARSLFAVGIRSGDRVHNSFSYHMTPAGSMFNTGCHALGATVIPGGVGQTEQQLEAIASLRPIGYSGTPSFLKILFDKADELGVDIGCISKALVSGEAYPPSIRAEFTARGVFALQCYGTADLGLIAYESSDESGLIIDEEIYI
ncbi:MAG: phenylacetate--CoA ligase family protein, partial [Gammaproteobacteria bacterium]|nr:phenylacetate--CoA ligase family protein [Gammaproteobacteria bacterium]